MNEKAKVESAPTRTPPPFGELAEFLEVLVETMEANGQTPEAIADTVKCVSAQGGVILSPDFARKPPSEPATREALKPCPFCGGLATIEDWKYAYEDGTTIQCSVCGACISESVVTCDNWHQTVVEKWNRRPQCATDGGP